MKKKLRIESLPMTLSAGKPRINIMKKSAEEKLRGRRRIAFLSLIF